MKKVLSLVALLLALALLGLLMSQRRKAAGAEHALQEAYLSALGEATELMEDLTLSMEKALISQDAAQTALMLGNIRQSANAIGRALSFLPLPQEALSPAMTLVDSLSEESERLTLLLVRNGSLSMEDRAALKAQLSACALLDGQLATAQQDVLEGRLSFDRVVHASEAPTAAPGASVLPDAKGLPRTKVTEGQALTLAKDFVGAERVTGLESAPNVTNGIMPAWGVTVQTADLQLNLEVTRIGGKVLLMVPETAGFPVVQTSAQCVEAAQRFLDTRALTGMLPIWQQRYDGMCVITFVATQNDILLYPDRITVQVRMDTAEVVGLEARSYWLNHTPRRLPQPALSKDEAWQLLSSELTVQDGRLCVIPHNGGEALCWQFTAVMNDETYLIYIDAQTGYELALEKYVMLEDGMMPA